MAYPYPTNINFSNGFADMFKYLNTVTNSWFSNMILISIYLIFASGFFLAKRDFAGAMAVAGFVTFVLATIFWVGELISGVTLIIVIAIAIVGFASLWLSPNE